MYLAGSPDAWDLLWAIPDASIVKSPPSPPKVGVVRRVAPTFSADLAQNVNSRKFCSQGSYCSQPQSDELPCIMAAETAILNMAKPSGVRDVSPAANAECMLNVCGVGVTLCDAVPLSLAKNESFQFQTSVSAAAPSSSISSLLPTSSVQSTPERSSCIPQKDLGSSDRSGFVALGDNQRRSSEVNNALSADSCRASQPHSGDPLCLHDTWLSTDLDDEPVPINRHMSVNSAIVTGSAAVVKTMLPADSFGGSSWPFDVEEPTATIAGRGHPSTTLMQRLEDAHARGDILPDGEVYVVPQDICTQVTSAAEVGAPGGVTEKEQPAAEATGVAVASASVVPSSDTDTVETWVAESLRPLCRNRDPRRSKPYPPPPQQQHGDQRDLEECEREQQQQQGEDPKVEQHQQQQEYEHRQQEGAIVQPVECLENVCGPAVGAGVTTTRASAAASPRVTRSAAQLLRPLSPPPQPPLPVVRRGPKTTTVRLLLKVRSAGAAASSAEAARAVTAKGMAVAAALGGGGDGAAGGRKPRGGPDGGVWKGKAGGRERHSPVAYSSSEDLSAGDTGSESEGGSGSASASDSDWSLRRRSTAASGPGHAAPNLLNEVQRALAAAAVATVADVAADKMAATGLPVMRSVWRLPPTRGRFDFRPMRRRGLNAAVPGGLGRSGAAERGLRILLGEEALKSPPSWSAAAAVDASEKDVQHVWDVEGGGGSVSGKRSAAAAATPTQQQPESDDMTNPTLILLQGLEKWRTHRARSIRKTPEALLRIGLLADVAARCPTSVLELEDVPGIPRPFIRRYGQEVLEICRNHTHMRVVREAAVAAQVRVLSAAAAAAAADKVNGARAGAPVRIWGSSSSCGGNGEQGRVAGPHFGDPRCSSEASGSMETSFCGRESWMGDEGSRGGGSGAATGKRPRLSVHHVAVEVAAPGSGGRGGGEGPAAAPWQKADCKDGPGMFPVDSAKRGAGGESGGGGRAGAGAQAVNGPVGHHVPGEVSRAWLMRQKLLNILGAQEDGTDLSEERPPQSGPALRRSPVPPIAAGVGEGGIVANPALPAGSRPSEARDPAARFGLDGIGGGDGGGCAAAAAPAQRSGCSKPDAPNASPVYAVTATASHAPAAATDFGGAAPRAVPDKGNGGVESCTFRVAAAAASKDARRQTTEAVAAGQVGGVATAPSSHRATAFTATLPGGKRPAPSWGVGRRALSGKVCRRGSSESPRAAAAAVASKDSPAVPPGWAVLPESCHVRSGRRLAYAATPLLSGARIKCLLSYLAEAGTAAAPFLETVAMAAPPPPPPHGGSASSLPDAAEQLADSLPSDAHGGICDGDAADDAPVAVLPAAAVAMAAAVQHLGRTAGQEQIRRLRAMVEAAMPAWEVRRVLACRALGPAAQPAAILRLGPGVSRDSVRLAFRRLSLLVHPDKNRSSGASEAFALVSAAANKMMGSSH